MLHPLSLAIGAGVTALAIMVSFLIFTSDSQELIIEPAPVIPTDIKPSPTIEPQRQAIITSETFLANASPVLGNPDAAVTLVEFGDYQCHYCNVFFHSTEDQIITKYVNTGKVKMIFKDFNIIGPDSVNASHGAHCAGDQNLFWEYHDILYSNWTGENNGWASLENLAVYAQELDGLGIDKWSACMEEGKHSQKILASNQDAKTLELTGTPAFFVIGPAGTTTPPLQLFGAQSFETFERVIEERLDER